MDYFLVKVEFPYIDEKGKTKTKRSSYLVDAMSCTEAEAHTVKYLTDHEETDFEIKAIINSSIAEVITSL